MEEPEVNLRDPWLAAVLALLVPGLGHLYQRRFFKAAVYSVCIIGLWAWGMQISDWKINQAPTNRPGVPRSKTFSFLAQAGVGAPALYAWYQAKRYNNGAGQSVTSLPDNTELSAPFTGRLLQQNGNEDIDADVTGTLTVAPTQGRFGDPTLMGHFHGTTAAGDPVEVQLGEGTELGPVLKAARERYVDAPVTTGTGDKAIRVGVLRGMTPRSFRNWFLAPLNETEEQDLHRELGKMHELALVFTWIAGLLNLLAIWDAFEGPAYGYGLMDDTEDEESDDSVEARQPNPAASTTKTHATAQARKAG